MNLCRFDGESSLARFASQRISSSGSILNSLDQYLSSCHIVDLVAVLSSSALLVSGVFRRVVVDGESFMDALFAAAGQG